MLKKILVATALFVSLSYAVDNDEKTDGIQFISTINVASSDTNASKKMSNCRAIMANTGGPVMLTIQPEPRNKNSAYTIVIELPDAVWIPIRNVVRVFPRYNGTDSTTCTIRDSTGTSRRGIYVGK